MRATVPARLRRPLALAFVALVVAAAPAAGEAEPGAKPLFELGLVSGGGYLPDYPAAGESRVQGLVLPYVVYRGEILRVGDEGFVRGRIVRTPRLELDISLSGSFPVESDDNDARRGMPDLDSLGEIGPRLQITLARAARDAKIDLEFPLRAVFSTDFTSAIDYRGIVFAPELAYQHENFLGGGVELKLSAGPSFASEKLMAYFYEVPPGFATADRPAFSARAGYLGTRLQLLLTKQFSDRLQSFFGLRGNFHHGSANRGSPLFRDTATFSVGFGLILSFYQSQRRGRE